jgi:hypothetical protein
MNPNAEVVAVDLHLPADLVFVPLLKENVANQLPVGLSELGQHPLHHLGSLFVNQLRLLTAGPIDWLGSALAERDRIFGPEVLMKDVLAYGAYIGANPFRMNNRILFSERAEETQKGFLAKIGGCLWISQPTAQFDEQQFPEIHDEMTFRLGVALRETS